jgi:hypothetical protein
MERRPMQEERPPQSFFMFVAGVVVGMFGFKQIQRFQEKVADQIREDADKKIQNIILQAIAKRVAIPIATLEKVLKDPSYDTEAAHAVRDIFQSARLIFVNKGNNLVETTLEIRWTDNQFTTLEMKWDWDQIPVEIRKDLLNKNKPIRVNWDFPDLTDDAADT